MRLAGALFPFVVVFLVALYASRHAALWIPERRRYSILFIVAGGALGWLLILIGLASEDANGWQILLVPPVGGAISALVFLLVLAINVTLIDGPASGFQADFVRRLGVDRGDRPLAPFIGLLVPIDRLRERRR